MNYTQEIMMKILVVEDNKKLLQTIEKEIIKHFEVKCCEDGEEALYLIKQGIYDLVVLDLMLPSLNGLEVLANTNVNVMFMHSKDDEVISYDQSFSKYEALFGTRGNFKFISYQNRGHDVVVDERLNQTLRTQIEEEYGSYHAMPKETRQMYDDVLYDVEKRLDLSVMQQIIDFYNQWIVKEYE